MKITIILDLNEFCFWSIVLLKNVIRKNGIKIQLKYSPGPKIKSHRIKKDSIDIATLTQTLF